MTTILFCVVILLSNIVQTVSGFAGTMLAMPLSIKLIGFNDSRYILNLLGIVVSSIVLIKNLKHLEVKSILEILIFMGLGIAIYNFVMGVFADSTLLTIYGIFIILVAIYQLSGRKIKVNNINSKILLILSGLIHGLFISGGAVLVIYALNKFEEKNKFRANLALVWLILNGYLLVQFHIQHIVPTSIMNTLLAVVFAFVGAFVGGKLVDKINQEKFELYTKILLIISGLFILL